MSSLLGIGGDIIVVPALIFGLPVVGVESPEVPKIAMATSLALIVPTSIASAQAHAAQGSIDWSMFALLAPCLVLGALASAIVVAGIEPRILVLVFVILGLRTARGLLRDRPTPEACAGQCAGYVFVPGVAAIGISAVLAAPLGAWAAHRLPAMALKKLFALFLVLAAASMASKTFVPNELMADARQTMASAAHFFGWRQASFCPPSPRCG